MKTFQPLNPPLSPAVAWIFLIAAAALAAPKSAFAQDVLITEFLAINDGGLQDEDGDRPDWIELTNASGGTIDLGGWHLTDDPADLARWTFPTTPLAPGRAVLVFASDKDRADAGEELHANFKLSGGGDYLALVRPDGTTVEHAYGPAYPQQVEDISYGLGQGATQTVLLATGAACRWEVPNNGSDGLDWTEVAYNDASWTPASTGVGYENSSGYEDLIGAGGDVLSEMRNVNGSIYIRIPFTVDDAGGLGGLTLGMQYDDGFIAYLNGRPVAESLAPADPDWESLASGTHDDDLAVEFEEFDLGGHLEDLMVGENVLAIHGLNATLGSSDLIFVPRLVALRVDPGDVGTPAYFATPTPGSVNSAGAGAIGPVFVDATRSAEPPGGGDSVIASTAADFSGVQGRDGWFYGYHQGGGAYDADSDFTAFNGGAGQGSWNGSTQQWDGGAWEMETANSAPWTSIAATSVHPNDNNPGPLQATVSRWVSDFDGTVTVSGFFHNTSANGDGTTGRVFHNGDEIFAQVTDGSQVSFSRAVELAAGDRLDFYVDTNGASNDGSDGTTYAAEITEGGTGGGLLVTAEVAPTLSPVAGVTAYSRVMYGGETATPLADDGAGADAAAGDGVYTGVIPTAGLAAGQMLRWRFEARDGNGTVSRLPPYPDPSDSPQYFGTVAADPSLATSRLPVLHWFAQDPGAANNRSGTRSSVYYGGEFYDNIKTDLHGQSTAGFPKKSYDFDFNTGDRFRWREGERRVKDINLLTNWADKAKVRNTIAYEMVRDAGAPYHFAFPVRVQQNGQFFSTADMVEDGDDRWLDRVGLDGNGALYKMYNRLDSSSSGVSKKTRKGESNADLQALINGLGQGGSAKLRYAYDNVNLPDVINYLAAIVMTNNRDHGHKNYYLYRDTEGTGEWTVLAWDVDLSLGRNWVSGQAYFDDTLSNNGLRNGANNRLKDLIFDTPALHDMFLRRVRTLMDEQLQAPGTPPAELRLEQRLAELVDLIDPADDNPNAGRDDADLDYQRWGSWKNNNAMRPAVDRIIDEWLPSRRVQLYNQIAEIPDAQNPAAVRVEVLEVDFNPASGNQDEEYIKIANRVTRNVDISRWTLSGAVDYTVRPGTVLLPGSLLLPGQGELVIARKSTALRARATSPKGGENLFAQGDYDGQLSARGETLFLRDAEGNLVDTFTYPGAPTPAQQHLRVTEIHYHPAPPTAEELAAVPGAVDTDFEFIELTNIGGEDLDISGAAFVEGIAFTFPGSTLIPPGGHVVVVSDTAAFAARYGDGANVVGEYTGRLSNGGESLRLRDAAGENVLTFDYNDRWFPPTDGRGHSLVVTDPAATPFDQWDEPERWGISAAPGGNPGEANPFLSHEYTGWLHYHFNRAERDDPAATGDGADFNRDGLNNLLHYAFGGDPRRHQPAVLPSSATMQEGGERYLALTFRRQRHALDLDYVVQVSDDLLTWRELPGTDVVEVTDANYPQANGDGTETALVRAATPLGASHPIQYLRLRVLRGAGE